MNELEKSKIRAQKAREDLKKYLQKKPITEKHFEILNVLKRSRSKGERSIYIDTPGPIRKDLTYLMDAGYINRNEKKKYFLSEIGRKKTREMEISVARSARYVHKKKRQEMKTTLKKWKKSLPGLEKRHKAEIEKMKKIHESVDPETKKAVNNNRFLWKGHSKWIEFSDTEGVRKMKTVEAMQTKSGKHSSKIYRRKNAIKEVERKLKGKSVARVRTKLPIELELEELAKRRREKLYSKKRSR